MNILMSVNKKFFDKVEEMIFSILYYSSEKVNIYLMYQEKELDEKYLDNMRNFISKTNKGEMLPIKIDPEMLKNVPTTDNEGNFFGIESYSRIFCAFLLPENVKKILYLDADMICTGDIKELYDIEFEGKTWVAVRDNGIQYDDLKRLGLPKDHKYINSGMLLINVEKLRKNYKAQEVYKLIMENREILIYPDQDFINKFFRGDIKIINRKYNLLAKDVKYEELEEKPLIIHYAGSAKPWDENVSRFDKEYIMPYYEMLRIQGKKEKLDWILNEHQKNGYRCN